ASDLSSNTSFGVTTRADGVVMVVWHVCEAVAGTCDVLGSVVRADGTAASEPFNLATTTQGDQFAPSVVAIPNAFVAAWDDASAADPDHSGVAVRARILYPPTP